MLYLQTIIFEYTCPLRQVALLSMLRFSEGDTHGQLEDVPWGQRMGEALGLDVELQFEGLSMLILLQKLTLTYMPYPKPMHVFFKHSFWLFLF